MEGELILSLSLSLLPLLALAPLILFFITLCCARAHTLAARASEKRSTSGRVAHDILFMFGLSTRLLSLPLLLKLQLLLLLLLLLLCQLSCKRKRKPTVGQGEPRLDPLLGAQSVVA